MEFENLHQHVAWLTDELAKITGSSNLESRVATLESRVAAADNLARVAMAEIKEHEAETNTLSQPAMPVMETTDGKITANDPKDGNVSG